MVKTVIWTQRAQTDRFRILEYWYERTQSKAYSIKLDRQIKDSIAIISRHPKIGKSTDILNVRIKILRDYLIIYQITPRKIIILAVWDSRQNPDSLLI
jgi:toxin YoeB